MKANIEGNMVVKERQLSKITGYDVNSMVLDYYTSKVIGYNYITDFLETKFYYKNLAQAYADLKATFPNTQIEIESYPVFLL